MNKSALLIYLAILVVLCTGFIAGARMLGEQGVYLGQGYMLTPAIAAIITRLFFYKPKFSDANLRFGKWRDWFRFWLISLGITTLSYAIYGALGAIRFDFTGQVFLERLTEQFAAAGQDINANLPPGFTPMTMLLLSFIGGLTIFNILPGLISGFGEEFGHRGFMFPQLYKIRPWMGFIIGGLLWFLWHIPLVLIYPQQTQPSLGEYVLNFLVLMIGSLFSFTYLAYAYVKSRSVWVAALAHIVMNNSAQAFSYFAVIQNQLLANAGLALTMGIVVAILYFKRELNIFRQYFEGSSPE